MRQALYGSGLNHGIVDAALEWLVSARALKAMDLVQADIAVA